LTVDSSTGLVIEAFGLDLATVATVQTLTATTVTNGGSVDRASLATPQRSAVLLA
jgi:hypothetical protein